MQLDTIVYRIAECPDHRACRSQECADALHAQTFQRGNISRVSMNEHVQAATTEPLFNPLSPEFIRDPYPSLCAAAHHRSDACHAVRRVRREPARRGEPGAARQALRQGFCRADHAALRTEDHGRADLPQHEPLDAAAGSARPYPVARPGGEGLYRAPGRGHASAHPADRRRNARCHRRSGPHGSDRGFCVSAAGDDHLRHARDSRGASRGVLQGFARWRAPARSGAAVAGRNRAGQCRQLRCRRCISSNCSSCAAASPATI